MEKSLRAVNLEKVKAKIVKKIFDTYKYSVRDFAESEEVKRLPINPRNLPSYLSKGSTSLPTLNVLCKHFGLRPIVKKTTVVKTTTYHYGKDSK